MTMTNEFDCITISDQRMTKSAQDTVLNLPQHLQMQPAHWHLLLADHYKRRVSEPHWCLGCEEGDQGGAVQGYQEIPGSSLKFFTMTSHQRACMNLCMSLFLTGTWYFLSILNGEASIPSISL